MPKPVHYSFEVCFNGLDGDSTGFEASTPVVPVAVGDYLEPGFLEPGGEPLQPDQAFRVFAVKHSFKEFDSHVAQYVSAAVEVAKKPG